jgi:hypothetical protein
VKYIISKFDDKNRTKISQMVRFLSMLTLTSNVQNLLFELRQDQFQHNFAV